MQPFLMQLVDVTLIQLTNWRWSWRGAIITSVLLPVLSTLGLGLFASDSGPITLGYIVIGNMVLSLLFGTVNKVSSNFSYIRITGMLDYFATLPLYRVTVILATVIAFMAMALPSVIATLIISALVLHLPILISPWIVVVLPLIGLALSGLGAWIGLVCRNPQEVDSISIPVTFLMLALGPVLIPPDRLPAIMNTVGLLSPATYAASALRQTVLGIPDRIPLAVDMLVLAVILVGLLWLVGQRMDWRRG